MVTLRAVGDRLRGALVDYWPVLLSLVSLVALGAVTLERIGNNGKDIASISERLDEGLALAHRADSKSDQALALIRAYHNGNGAP